MQISMFYIDDPDEMKDESLFWSLIMFGTAFVQVQIYPLGKSNRATCRTERQVSGCSARCPIGRARARGRETLPSAFGSLRKTTKKIPFETLGARSAL
eukprot:2734140-Pyramimonas_sp.AAC.2